jgi:hypothetical protein
MEEIRTEWTERGEARKGTRGVGNEVDTVKTKHCRREKDVAYRNKKRDKEKNERKKKRASRTKQHKKEYNE